ncbi:Importin-11 [Chytridiales sp. JEL 0842]|nr:Importin-11 [Chytridiales sp. JEL 0842]
MESIVPILVRALSHDPQAEAQLKAWEVERGYHLMLLEISNTASLPHNIRHLAALNLKNGLEKYWRRSAPNAIQSEEKAQIRAKLKGVFCDESNKLNRAYAESISKVGRVDFPREWPDLLQTLLSTVQATFTVPHPDLTIRIAYQQSGLYTLHRVIKELFSMSLMSSKAVLFNIAPELCRYLSALFFERTDSFLTSLSHALQSQPSPAEIQQIVSDAAVSRLALKCLRTVITYGYPERSQKEYEFKPTFNKSPDAVRVFQSLVPYLQKFLEARQALQAASATNSVWIPVNKTVGSMCVLVGKTFIDLQTDRFTNFLLVDGGLGVIGYYWGFLVTYNGDKSAEVYERILLQALLLVRRVVKNSEYYTKPPHRHPDIDTAKELIKTQLLTEDFILSCCQLLVSKYLMLQSEDLQKWDEEPETFVADEETDLWEYNIRMSAQKLYMDLIDQHTSTLCPLIMRMVSQVSQGHETQEGIMLKDAVYSAVQLGAYQLYDHVDFDGWVVGKLTEEVSRQGSVWLKVLRRRVALLIGAWINVKCAPETRGPIYALLLRMSSPQTESDLVVRLTAINSLKLVLEESFMVGSEALEPYVDGFVGVLCATLEELDEYETKVTVLNALNAVVMLMGPKVNYADRAEDNGAAAKSLGFFWESDHALQENSMLLHPLIVPAIENSIASTDQNNFLEDCIDLWLSTLQNTTTTTSQLLSLFPHTPHLLDLSSEHLKTALELIEAYFVLDPSACLSHPLQQTSIAIFTRLASMLHDLKPEAVRFIMKLLMTILRSATSRQTSSPPTFQLLVQTMVTSGLLERLLRECVGSVEKGYADFIAAGFAGVVGVCAVWDPEGIGRYCQSLGDGVLGEFVDAYARVYDAMTYPIQRKQLAMCCISGVTSELFGMSEDRERIHFYEAVPNSHDEETLDYKRRLELQKQDPIVSTPLIPFVRGKLEQCANAVGGGSLESFQEKLVQVFGVDPVVVKEVFRVM